MSLEDHDDRPRRDFYQFLPIGLAMMLTAAAVGLCFFTFSVPKPIPDKPATAATPNGEVMIGVGQGSTIYSKPAPAP